MNTARAADLFLTAKATKGLSGRTLETYRYRLGILARRHAKLPTDPETLERFLLTTGPSIDTRETYYRLLRNLYRWLKRRRHIRANPVSHIEAPRIRRKVARRLALVDLSRLLNHPGHPSKHRAFLYLLADTGVRLSEALSVNSPDQVREETVVVIGKRDDREVPISPSVRAMVLKALPWPWGNRDTAGRAVRRAFAKAGLDGRRASAHTLRHTFATLWAGDETILDGIAGWRSSRMRERYRPYNLARAIIQHRENSPLKGVGFSQERLI